MNIKAELKTIDKQMNIIRMQQNEHRKRVVHELKAGLVFVAVLFALVFLFMVAL